jgi:trigger factor
MNIQLANQTPTDATLTIQLEASDYQPLVDKKLKEYSRKATIKGFRPGKVPPALIKKMYGKAIIVEEINTLTSKSLYDYIKENELPIVGDPMPATKSEELNFDAPKDFEFVFRLGLVPEFSYDLAKLEVKDFDIQLNDEQFSQETDHIKRKFGKTDHPEVSEAGDFLYGVLHNTLHTNTPEKQHHEEEEHDPEQHADHFHQQILLPLNQVSESELEKFIGISKEAAIKVDIQKLFKDSIKGITLATGISAEKAEQLSGEFEFILSDITRTAGAEMNEELFNRVFPGEEITTEEAFVEKLKTQITDNYKREATWYAEKQLKDELIAKTDIQLPHEFLKDWLTQINEGKFSREQVEAEYEGFANNLKWDLLCGKISKEAEFKVEMEEVQAKARQMVKNQFRIEVETPDMARIIDQIADNYLREENGKNATNLVNQVVEDKVLNLLLPQLNLTKETVNRDEFEKIAYSQE